MRFLILLGLVVLVSSCSSGPAPARVAHIMVTDARGAPLSGALLQPEVEDERFGDNRSPDPQELAERTSDSQGLIYADLQPFYWASDDCIHFVVKRQGYGDASFSVSRDLFPPLIKIRMDALEGTGNTKPSPKEAVSPAN
jgi:hypothetical protein